MMWFRQQLVSNSTRKRLLITEIVGVRLFIGKESPL